MTFKVDHHKTGFDYLVFDQPLQNSEVKAATIPKIKVFGDTLFGKIAKFFHQLIHKQDKLVKLQFTDPNRPNYRETYYVSRQAMQQAYENIGKALDPQNGPESRMQWAKINARANNLKVVADIAIIAFTKKADDQYDLAAAITQDAKGENSNYIKLEHSIENANQQYRDLSNS